MKTHDQDSDNPPAPDDAITDLGSVLPIHCLKCNYNLSGLATNSVCPECKTCIAESIARSSASETLLRTFRRRVIWIGWILLVSILLMIAGTITWLVALKNDSLYITPTGLIAYWTLTISALTFTGAWIKLRGIRGLGVFGHSGIESGLRKGCARLIGFAVVVSLLFSLIYIHSVFRPAQVSPVMYIFLTQSIDQRYIDGASYMNTIGYGSIQLSLMRICGSVARRVNRNGLRSVMVALGWISFVVYVLNVVLRIAPLDQLPFTALWQKEVFYVGRTIVLTFAQALCIWLMLRAVSKWPRQVR